MTAAASRGERLGACEQFAAVSRLVRQLRSLEARGREAARLEGLEGAEVDAFVSAWLAGGVKAAAGELASTFRIGGADGR